MALEIEMMDDGKYNGKISPVQKDLDLPVLPMFSQLNTFDANSEEWRETSRWVKFQEDVRNEGKRWSKPFVPSLHWEAILDLKECFSNGIVAFDVEASNIVDILGKYLF